MRSRAERDKDFRSQIDPFVGAGKLVKIDAIPGYL